MGKFDEYLNRAKNLAEEASDASRSAAGEVVGRAKELSDEHSKVKELAQNAREQTTSFALGAKEKVQGVLQDAKTVKEIRQGVIELEALPEFDGSIIYKMELEAMINDLGSLCLFIGDGRLDDASVVEEIRKVMGKVKPSADLQAEVPEQSEEGGQQEVQLTDEERAIEKAKFIAYSACVRALEAMKVSAE